MGTGIVVRELEGLAIKNPFPQSQIRLECCSNTHRRQRRGGMEGMYPLQYFKRGDVVCHIPPQSFVDFVVRALTNNEQNRI